MSAFVRSISINISRTLKLFTRVKKFHQLYQNCQNVGREQGKRGETNYEILELRANNQELANEKILPL